MLYTLANLVKHTVHETCMTTDVHFLTTQHASYQHAKVHLHNTMSQIILYIVGCK